MHQLAALGDFALYRIEAKLANLDGRVFSAGRSLDAAHRGADACNQLAHAEWLGDIVVRAQLQRLDLLLFRIAHGEHENGQPWRKGANAAQGFNAADSGHIHVKQNHIKAACAQRLESLFAARDIHDLKAELHQRRPERPADGRFIVNNKNANCCLCH